MKSKKRSLYIIGAGLLVFISLIGVLRTVFIGADIDESYALTMAMRIADGDTMFGNMWEPHQTSALLYAPIVWAFKSITGSMEGALVFMRSVGVFIQLTISIYLFWCLKEDYGKVSAFVAAVFYFNFTPKHIQSPEFTSIFYWQFMLLFLFLYQYEKGKKKRYLYLLGISLSTLVLCYPVMVLLFPVLCLFLALDEKDAKSRWLAILHVFLCCSICAIVFMSYLCIRTGIHTVINSVPMVMMDESHKQNLGMHIKEHALGIWDMAKITLIFTVLIQIVREWLKKKTEIQSFLWICLFLGQGIWSLYQFHTIQKVNFMILYPILFQYFLLLGILYLWNGKEKREHECIAGKVSILSVIAFCGILLLSNLPTMYSASFLYPGLIWLALAIFGKEYRNSQTAKKSFWLSVCLCVGLLLVQIFVTRICLVRFTATQRKNIFEGYQKVQEGVLDSVYLAEFDYSQYLQKMDALQRYVGPKDRLLFIGSDMFLYSSLDANQISTCNTISTPAFSGQLMEYYDRNSDKIPTVVFVDREYGADYSVLLEQEPLASFMKQYFNLDHPVYDGPLTIYQR